MQKGVVRKESKTTLIVGGEGVGKTHLVALILNLKPLSLRMSTPCAKVSPWAQKNIRLQMGMSSIKLLTEEMYTKMMIKSGKDDKSRLTSYDVKRPSTQSKSSEKIQIPIISDVDKHYHES